MVVSSVPITSDGERYGAVRAPGYANGPTAAAAMHSGNGLPNGVHRDAQGHDDAPGSDTDDSDSRGSGDSGDAVSDRGVKHEVAGSAEAATGGSGGPPRAAGTPGASGAGGRGGYIDAYKAWVVANGDGVKRIEDVIRTLSFLVPSRFEDAELVSEGIYAATNLLGLYNDSILAEARGVADEGGGPAQSVLRAAQWGLTALANADVVAEMLSYRVLGKNGKWNVIAGVEVIRALLKVFVLLRGKDSRLLGGGAAQPPEVPPEQGDGADANGDEAAALEEMQDGEGEDAAEGAGGEAPMRLWRGKRSGVRIPLPPDFPVTMSSRSHDSEERRLRLAGELLHIARPVVYALSRRWTSRGSWIPIILSGITDYASFRLSQKADSFRAPAPDAPLKNVGNRLLKVLLWFMNPPAGLSAAEAAEMSRRKQQWAFYLLRSPLFETIVKRSADGVVSATSWIPLLGLLLGYARDMMVYYQKHHFYVAAAT